MAFQKGNRHAAKPRLWEAALRRYFTQNPNDLAKAAEKLAAMAMEGDVQAMREIGDRLDGKPVQAVDMGGSLNISKTAEDLTDDELAGIAAGGGARVTKAPHGSQSVN